MLRTPAVQGRERTFLAERVVLEQWGVKVKGRSSGILMRLVCKVSHNQLFFGMLIFGGNWLTEIVPAGSTKTS